MPDIVVSGAFDNIRSRDLRFLQEAAKLGDVSVLLWDDQSIERLTGAPPKFALVERVYFLDAVRYVSRALPWIGPVDLDQLPSLPGSEPQIWVDTEAPTNQARQFSSRKHGLNYLVITEDQMKGFPTVPPSPATAGRKKVVITGCYDWLHSGHVRFFEEASSLGDLTVIVGHDANIRLLKGPDHPLLPEEERCYQVSSICYVSQALISSGNGWVDADPEIQLLKPDIYVVNEDGDKGGKREYCLQHGIEYRVLQRIPAPGLPNRSSTELRGF